MALNIKDPEAERLAGQLAERLQMSKTGAIRYALQQQLQMLESRSHDRLQDVLHVLRSEIWPLTTPSEPITKKEREDILGYSTDGV
jgi:antitoxin VapB